MTDIKLLNELQVDEFNCLEAQIKERFFFVIKRKLYVLEAQLLERVKSCKEGNNCFFRSFESECPKFACSRVERRDGYDIRFVDVTCEYDENDLLFYYECMKEG